MLANRVKVATSTTGVGTITLGDAAEGFQSFDAGGITDGATVSYTIENGLDFECGTGTYTAAGPTLSRSPVDSSNGGAAVNLSGTSVVFISPLASDLDFATDLSLKLDVSAYTSASILAKLLTVDGSGSGLDADRLRNTVPSAFGLSLINDADAAAAQATLGLVFGVAAGTNILTRADGDGRYQPLDADLTAIAALTSAANKMPYSTGAGAWALADLTAAGRALLDDADAAAQRTTLSVQPTASPTFTGTLGAATIAATGAIKSNSASAGIGYDTGAGGAVTQATSKVTNVNVPWNCGQITLHNASVASNTTVAFRAFNAAVAATDIVHVWIVSGAASPSAYQVWANGNGGGEFGVNLRNITGGALGEAVVIGFIVLKGVAS